MGSELTVGDIMTKKVVVIPMSDTVGEVARLMKKHNIGSVIVVEDKVPNRAKGIITERDIVVKILGGGKNPYETPVQKVMSTPLRVVKPKTSIEDAAKAMRENKIKRLPVVNDKNELIGVVSEGDIMRIFPAVVDLLEERAAMK
ncbi:CBS domain-containing protein [Candidatus Micrarchaeota archaeon]|nr:CBS domain-containing protein [Candidatus Micrarchaeota archaeon]